MKKISFLFSLLLAIFLSSCNHSSDMADQIIGKWEMVHYKESSWWYYYNEDGTQTETYTLDEESDVLLFSWILSSSSAELKSDSI